MQYTVTVNGACAGGNHLHLTITPQGGQGRPLEISRDELAALAPSTPEEIRANILQRIRSAALESGANTLPQLRAALEGVTFKV